MTLGDYLENVSLLSNVDVAEDETANRVALMTIHTAKGLEFPYVFVAGMEENLFPSGGWLVTPKDLEEERRLFYVALTRAKKAVSLSFSDTRMRNGKHESNSPSRFLRELAPQYLDKPLMRDGGFGGGIGGGSFGGFSGRFTGAPGRHTPSVAEKKADAPSGASRSVPPFSRPAPSFSRSSSAPAAKPPVIDPSFVPDPMTSFKAGDRIEHNRFGAGEVLEVSGQIPDLKAKVRFDAYGEKLLLLKFAKLRHGR